MNKKNFSNKFLFYAISFFFLASILFFNDSGVYYLLKNKIENQRLKEEIELLNYEIEHKKIIIDSLKSESDIIEKIAREKYNYKKPNEKVIIIEFK